MDQLSLEIEIRRIALLGFPLFADGINSQCLTLRVCLTDLAHAAFRGHHDIDSITGRKHSPKVHFQNGAIAKSYYTV